VLVDVGIFQQNITNAAGFIAVALVYFRGWRPLGVMLGRSSTQDDAGARAPGRGWGSSP
jgi:hypothetical protein